MSLALNSNPQLTASEIRSIVLEARRQQSEHGNPIQTPETERVVQFWKEHRPKMFKRLASVSPDAPLCLASHLWDQANRQAIEAAGAGQFPTYNEAMETAQREMLMMEPETAGGQQEAE